MSVYVDRERSDGWCHMIADTLDELHAMARAIGMRPEWFQGPPAHRQPHYDLRPATRAKAVRRGAIEVSRMELVRIMQRQGAAV